VGRLNAIAKYVYENRLKMAWIDCFVEMKQQWADITGPELEAALAVYAIRDPDETLQSLVDLEDALAKNEAQGLITNRGAVDALWDGFWRLRGRPIGERTN